jgi:hypothetical protein
MSVFAIARIDFSVLELIQAVRVFVCCAFSGGESKLGAEVLSEPKRVSRRHLESVAFQGQ